MTTTDVTLHFQNTNWLWALLLLLPLAALFFYAQKKREQLLAHIVAKRLRASLVGRVSMIKRTLRAILVLLALGFLMIALAQPRLGYEERSVLTHGRDVIIAIDTSRSMMATDVAPTRLARAKLMAEDLLELLPGDRVGLIAFAGKAFLQAPMTLDHNAVRDALNELDTNVIPKGGTNIEEAIRLAIAALGKGEGTERALVLMTDGEDLDGNAIAAAHEAKAAGVKIFTIGIGSPEGSLIPILNEQNGRDFVRDQNGKPVLSKLDVPRLQEIASITGGFYQPFGGGAARSIVQQGITPLAGGQNKMQVIRRPIERYEWPLGAALLLLTLWWMIDERRRSLKKIMLLFFLFLFPTLSRATPGLNEYQQGNYQAALQTFEQQLKKGNDSDAARFDAGTAAYKQGDYKKAVDYFTSAMTSGSSKIEQAATYNLANALVREGETASESSEKLSDWNSAVQHYETILKADPKNQQAKENQATAKKLIEDLKKQEEEKKKNPQQKNNQNQQQQNQQQKNSNDQQNSNQQNNPDQSQLQQGSQPQQQNQKQNPQQKNSDQQKDQQQNSNDQQNSNSQNNQQGDQQKNGGQQDQKNSSPQSTPPPRSSASPDSNASSSPTPAENPMNSSDAENKNGPQSKPQSGSQADASPTPKLDASARSSSENQKNNAGEKETSPPTAAEKKEGTLSGGEQKAPQAASDEESEQGTMSKAQAEAILRSMKDEEQRVPFRHGQEEEEATRDW